MERILPSKETADRKGWKYQVQWTEAGKPCFVRCATLEGANYWLHKMRAFEPELIDFAEVLT